MTTTRVTVALTDADLARLRAVLEARAGLRFDDSRRDALAGAVGYRMARSGAETVSGYLDGLDADQAELQELLDEVTIPETHFFRNPPQVHALAAHVLPELLQHALDTTGRLRIWSAGCSTGEEPYTVAMLLLEAMDVVPGAHRLDVSVVGTDISSRVLAAAERAEYNQRSVAMATPERLARFFVAEGDRWRVTDEVKALVTLRRHNLAGDPPPFLRGERLDLVLCRNVTIYFDRETTRALMGRLHVSLRDGGFLFLGHSETLWQLSDDFRLVTLGDAFVYRRDDGPASERRRVLPDRREPAPTVAPVLEDRRRGPRRLGDLLRRLGPTEDAAPPAPRAPLSPRAPLAPPAHVARARPAPTPSAPGAVDPLVRGREEFAAGRYKEAAACAEEVLRGDPMASAAHYLRGHALLVLGDDGGALSALRAATYTDPTYGLAWFLMAGALGRLGQGRAARLAYAEAASHLGTRHGDADAIELGGRSVRELADLCRTLAQAP